MQFLATLLTLETGLVRKHGDIYVSTCCHMMIIDLSIVYPIENKSLNLKKTIDCASDFDIQRTVSKEVNVCYSPMMEGGVGLPVDKDMLPDRPI